MAESRNYRWQPFAVESLLEQVWPTVRFSLPETGDPEVSRGFDVGDYVSLDGEGRVVPCHAGSSVGVVVQRPYAGEWRVRVRLHTGGEALVDPAWGMRPAVRDAELEIDPRRLWEVYGEGSWDTGVVERHVMEMQRRTMLVRERATREVLRRYPDLNPTSVTWVEGQTPELATGRPCEMMCDCWRERGGVGYTLRDWPGPHEETVFYRVYLRPEFLVAGERHGGVRRWAVALGRCDGCRRVYVTVDRADATARPATAG
jgi:hypothetical protein